MNSTVAKQLFEKDELVPALALLNDLIANNASDIQSILLRARIFYKMQKWGDAMNDYARVLEMDPENAEAKSGIEMSGSILGYFTPDMFNP